MEGSFESSQKVNHTYCDPKLPSSASPVCRASWTAHPSPDLLHPVPSEAHQHKLSKAAILSTLDVLHFKYTAILSTLVHIHCVKG